MTDVNQLITTHLDDWTAAIEKKSSAGRGNSGAITLYGIKKLRVLILELAVRGKLVPQDENDGDVASYLDEIWRLRNELVRHGKSKKTKALPKIAESEIPFNAPKSWVWTRLQDVTGYIQRGKSPKYAEDGKVQVVSQKCVQWGQFDLEKARFIKDESVESYGPERFLRSGDILWNSTGTGTVGRVLAVAVEDDETLVADSHVTVVRSISGCPKFLEVYLSSAGIQDRIEPTHERSFVSGSTKQVELNVSTVIALPVPLPPLAEQHRIVAKVDELMGLCNALERQAEDSLKAHQTLVETCLATLTNSQTPEELTQNWTRIEAHFDTLFTTEESVKAFRRAIVQLGIIGRLTHQSVEDVQLDRLLRDIEIERSQTAIGRKANKQTASTPQSTDYAFALPKTWGLLRLGQLALSAEAGWSPRCPERPKDGEEWGVLKVSAVTWGKFDGGQNKALPNNLEPRPELQVRPGDFVISRANTAELVARSAIVPPDVEKRLMLSDKLIRFRFSEKINVRFLNLVNSSTAARDYYREVAGGTSSSMKNVSRPQIADLLVPIPPREEQDRIVQKVDELFEVCDALLGKFPVPLSASRALANTLTSKIH